MGLEGSKMFPLTQLPDVFRLKHSMILVGNPRLSGAVRFEMSIGPSYRNFWRENFTLSELNSVFPSTYFFGWKIFPHSLKKCQWPMTGFVGDSTSYHLGF